jgi:hypothetical protein
LSPAQLGRFAAAAATRGIRLLLGRRLRGAASSEVVVQLLAE